MTRTGLRRILAPYIKQIANESDTVSDVEVEKYTVTLSRDFDTLYADVTLKKLEVNTSVHFDPNLLDDSIDRLVMEVYHAFSKIKSQIVESGEIF